MATASHVLLFVPLAPPSLRTQPLSPHINLKYNTFSLRLLKHRRPRYSSPRRYITSSLEQPAQAAQVILEGDLLAYRPQGSQLQWTVAAVTHVEHPSLYHVRPVHIRQSEPNPTLEYFVDWNPSTPTTTISAQTFIVKLIDASYEQRVMQDRLQNPHGEISEDCWRVPRETITNLPAPIRYA